MGFPDRLLLMPTARSRACAWCHIGTSLRLLYSCHVGWQCRVHWVRYHTQPIAELIWNKQMEVTTLSSGFSQTVAYRSFPLRDTICLFSATYERSDHSYRFDLMHRYNQNSVSRAKAF